MVVRKLFGDLGEKMLPKEYQIRENRDHSCIVGEARDSEGTIPKFLGYKSDGGELYF